MDLNVMKQHAWVTMMATAKSARVALQIGYLIDKARSVREVMLAVAMIGDFEIEEEGAAEEAALNAAQAA